MLQSSTALGLPAMRTQSISVPRTSTLPSMSSQTLSSRRVSSTASLGTRRSSSGSLAVRSGG